MSHHNTKRHIGRFALLAAAVVWSGAGGIGRAEPSQARITRPNIVFILSDDLSYRDLSYLGQKHYATVHLDELARQGLCFTEAYSGSAECAPSRASLMTGMHMGHCRVRSNRSVRGQDHLLDADVTVAEVLRQAGYATGFMGKWGIGLPGTAGVPDKQGFDEALGYYDQQRAHTYFPDYLMHNGRRLILPENHGFNMKRLYRYNSRPVDRLDGVKNQYDAAGRLKPDGVADPDKVKYSEDLFEQAALAFIDKHQRQPFFLYYATQLPHGPCIIPQLGSFQNKTWPLKNKEWAAMITRLDRSVGRIVGRLDKLGILEKTVIFFAGDNGYSQWGYFGRPAYQDDPLFHNKGPWPLGKFNSTREGGLRVPLVVYWKGTIVPGRSDHLCALYDFLPTAAELAGVTAPPTDGLSFLPTLMGRPQQQAHHAYLYWENGGRSRHAQSVRMGPWWACRSHPGKPIELYRIDRDPACRVNLADDNPDVVNKVRRVFTEAHRDSRWYINPGDTAAQIAAKRQQALRAKCMQNATPPNSTYSRPTPPAPPGNP